MIKSKESFISINEWINEQKSEPVYGCIMMDSKISNWENDHIGGIDSKDVYIKPNDDSYGLEEIPHITILYGIHEDEIDPEVIMDVVKEDMTPITVTVDNISLFETDKYDVVKYDIPITKELKKFRKMFEDNFPNTQNFKEYKPHMTIAYVKPGTGKKYKKKLEEPFEVTFDKGVYSFHETDEDGNIDLIRKEHVFKDESEEINLSDES